MGALAMALGQFLQVSCLAANVYHEARGEPLAGRLAVAQVTMNRVRSPRFPDDVCSVVFQRGQFSWTAHAPPVTDREAWAEALRVATLVYEGRARRVVGPRALFYHERSVSPRWAGSMVEVRRVGAHTFYRPMTREERREQEAGLRGDRAPTVGHDLGRDLAGR